MHDVSKFIPDPESVFALFDGADVLAPQLLGLYRTGLRPSKPAPKFHWPSKWLSVSSLLPRRSSRTDFKKNREGFPAEKWRLERSKKAQTGVLVGEPSANLLVSSCNQQRLFFIRPGASVSRHTYDVCEFYASSILFSKTQSRLFFMGCEVSWTSQDGLI